MRSRLNMRQNVFGQFDAFAKKFERAFHVTLIARDGSAKIVGDAAQVAQAEEVQRTLTQLLELSRTGRCDTRSRT